MSIREKKNQQCSFCRQSIRLKKIDRVNYNCHFLFWKIPEVQQVALRAQMPLPLTPQAWPELEHSWGLYASRAHRAAMAPPILQPVIGEQQILGPKHRPDRAGPHRVHWNNDDCQRMIWGKAKQTNLFVELRWSQCWHQRAFTCRWTVGDETCIRVTCKEDHDDGHRQNEVKMRLSHWIGNWCGCVCILEK